MTQATRANCWIMTQATRTNCWITTQGTSTAHQLLDHDSRNCTPTQTTAETLHHLIRTSAAVITTSYIKTTTILLLNAVLEIGVVFDFCFGKFFFGISRSKVFPPWWGIVPFWKLILSDFPTTPQLHHLMLYSELVCQQFHVGVHKIPPRHHQQTKANNVYCGYLTSVLMNL